VGSGENSEDRTEGGRLSLRGGTTKQSIIACVTLWTFQGRYARLEDVMDCFGYARNDRITGYLPDTTLASGIGHDSGEHGLLDNGCQSGYSVMIYGYSREHSL